MVPLSTTNTLSFFLRRDADGVFAEPVTDDIAPGYSSIIKQPMDLLTMASKLDNNQYSSVKEFKVVKGNV